MKLKNHILLYLCKDFEIQRTDKEIGVKEKLIKNDVYALQHLGGHIFYKFYKKFNQQLKNNEMYIRYCSILSAGKVHQDEQLILINAKNRIGLWKVDNDMHN